MNKPFFDVFPTLKVNNEMQNLFQEVEVSKVATNSRREFIRVHILSRHLLKKQDIFAMEDKIKEQLFTHVKIRIEIVEKYELSEQYTPENLLNEYLDSFLIELNERSVVERNMLQNAGYFFEDENILCLTLTDSIVAQGRKESLIQYLMDVYENRFGKTIEVRVVYEKAKDSSLKYNEVKLQQEVDAIMDHVDAVKAEKALEKEAKEAKEAKAEKKSEEKKFEKKFEKKNFQGAQGSARRGEDPNLIYGRDFYDEEIELSQVVGEMGEITFRGQIRDVETREIRNEKTIIMFPVTDFTDTIMVKMFVRNDQLADVLGAVKKGTFVKMKGVTTIDRFDGELIISSVFGIKKISDFRESRKDTAPEKRVELHCHTMMSDMDCVAKVMSLQNVHMTGDIRHLRLPITVLYRDLRMPIISCMDWIKRIHLKSYMAWKDIL